MRRFLLILLFLFLPLCTYAGDGKPYNNIVFFGDSLSDDGNLYNFDLGFLPKSPPYFYGRFSNNYVWADLAAQYFTSLNIASVNYAIGGETVIFHDPFKGYLPYTLTASVDSYLLHTLLQDRSTTLFVLWIGANDYLHGTDDVDQLTSDVVNTIEYSLERLIQHGGMNFLVINLPDLSKTPYGSSSPIKANLNQLSLMHNQKLSAAIADIQNNYKNVNIHLFDISSMLDDLIANPDVYNQQYQTNITDTTTACWLGGYTKDKQLQQKEIQQQLEAYLQQRKLSPNALAKNFNVEEFASYVADNPALSEAYSVAKQAESGILPCNNPDEHVFWDHIHPTKPIHFILSKVLISYIQQSYTTAQR